MTKEYAEKTNRTQEVLWKNLMKLLFFFWFQTWICLTKYWISIYNIFMLQRKLSRYIHCFGRVPAIENIEWCSTFDSKLKLDYVSSGWFCSVWNRYRDDKFSFGCTISTPVERTFWCMSWGHLRVVGCKRNREVLKKAEMTLFQLNSFYSS